MTFLIPWTHHHATMRCGRRVAAGGGHRARCSSAARPAGTAVIALIAAGAFMVPASTLLAAPPAPADAEPDTIDLRRDGAFGFPQAQATVLADIDNLRLSAFIDPRHLYVQAIVWPDDNEELGQTNDGRPIGDRSALVMDLDAAGAITPNVDRTYLLNPWPVRPGVHYQIQLGDGASTKIQLGSNCRGAIRYVDDASGRRVRVDSFFIPLASLNRHAGDSIRLAYWGASPVPELLVNSVGHEAAGIYSARHLSHDRFHELKLVAGDTVVLADAVPNGHEDDVPERARPAPLGNLPTVGEAPPELVAADWINLDGPVTLAALRGHVVVVEFWATWCGPCVASIPHLNALHDMHYADGLRLISVTDQSREHIEAFMEKTPMRYALGVGSELRRTYGVRGIPHAFIVGRDGMLRWHGHPSSKVFHDELEAALKEGVDEDAG